MTCECASGYIGRNCEIHLLDTVDGECGLENCIIQCPYDKEEQQPCVCRNGTKIYNSKFVSFFATCVHFPETDRSWENEIIRGNACRSIEIRVQNQIVERDIPEVWADYATRQCRVLRWQTGE